MSKRDLKKCSTSQQLLKALEDNMLHPIEEMCDELKKFLMEKNKLYGNSALEPTRIFSKQNADEQIKVRLDDKISRIQNSDILRKNDIVDLTGYLILYMVSQKWINFDDLID